MKPTTWKAVFAAMSPSPVFQAISEFAERRVNERRSGPFKQIDKTKGLSSSRKTAGRNLFLASHELPNKGAEAR